MTNRRVDFDFRDGILGGVDGIVRAYPTRRFLLEVDDETVVVLPEAVEIPIIGGLGSVKLLPNDQDVWTWMFVESFGRGALTRWCHVLDADGQRYAELAEIDPITYDAVV